VNADGTPVHPKGIGCGFLVDVDGTRVFWPGDSDALPGHDELDVSLFVPSIAKSFTMDRHSAADLAEAMDPDLVLPIHYNTFEGTGERLRCIRRRRGEQGIPVVLDER